jgi:sulfonate transport system ATP-binding protein
VSASIHVRGLTQSFGDNRILADLDIDVAPGEFIALLGRSGSGKTTLLRLLAGLDEPTEGELGVAQPRAVVFQEPRLLPWKRTWENVVLGMPQSGAHGRAAAALAEVALSHRGDAWPLTLSGGEAQRAALARALVREPALLLLDEPFASLDALTRMRMHVLVEALWRRHGPAVLLVTHDVDEAILLADRVLVLADGHIALDVPVDISRPRSPAYAGFHDLRRTLLSALGVDALAEAPLDTFAASI